jgi:hypothetical protein
VVQANKGVPNKVLQANKVGQATKMVQANKGVPNIVVQANKMAPLLRRGVAAASIAPY